MKAIGQLASFRIYPEKGKSRLYYDVRVFASVQALRRYLALGGRLGYRRHLGRYGVAMCSSFRVWKPVAKQKRYRLRPVMGEILIPKRYLRTSVITHECTHAA